MANRTVKDAKSIKGTNPQYLVEKIIRSRIYDSKYWKEECFALTAELLVDKAMELRFVGGVFGGNIKPTPFLCLTLKMLQIQPEKEIIVEFIKNEEFKYVRALGAYYMRLTGTSLDCYNYLEPLLNDYRKLRRQNRDGVFELIYMDEFVDELLREERVCDIILPRIQKRSVLEETNQLQPRTSVLEEDEDDDDDLFEEELKEEEEKKKSPKKSDKSSKSSSHRDRGDRKRRHSSNSDSDDFDRRRRGDDDKSRSRKDDRYSDSRSRRKDKKKDRDSSYDRSDRDRERRDRDRTRGKDTRDRERGRDYSDYRSKDADRERNHHHRDKERDDDRHRGSSRYDH